MVQLGSAKEFFELASSEYPEPPVWRGEMYLELHRGVFTSQHRTKHGNRRNEALLREAELWATVAYLRCGLEYPAAKLQEIWEEILLMQFHDILPGSAIAWVHKEAERRHELASQSLIEIIEMSLNAISNQSPGEKRNLIVSAQPFSSDNVPALAISDSIAGQVVSQAKSEDLILDNGKLRVTFDKAGRIISMTDQLGRDSFAPGHPGNELRLHRDTPTLWDAWDIDKDYLTSYRVLDEVTQLSQGIDEAGNAYLETVRSISGQHGQNSTIKQRLSLAPEADWLDIALEIDWHESEKLLKLVFPLDIHAERIAAETQFGHFWRANNENTSWEKARYETCQHRYLFIPEQDWAVAFANDSTYGYSAFRTKSKIGKPLTEIGFSILRAPRFPDPEADQGQHFFKFRMKPNAKVLDAAHMAYQLNFPIRSIVGTNPVEPLVSSSSDQVVIETIKLAEDGSGDLIVRLYEAIGGRAQTTLTLDGVASEIKTINLLEHDLEQGERTTGSAIELSFRPFEVISVRFSKVKL
jgi:alpha-mannosidase